MDGGDGEMNPTSVIGELPAAAMADHASSRIYGRDASRADHTITPDVFRSNLCRHHWHARGQW
jgi:hypothetical protein